MRVLSCHYGVALTSCPVEARWGDLYSTSRDVTTAATWTSSAPTVLQVISPGVLAGEITGEAQVSVSYNGTFTTATFRVYPDEPPWRVCPSCEYHIRVQDAAGQQLEGVLAEIIAGHMVGRTAVSNNFGDAIFVRDVIEGPITVRGTKAGYREWVGSATLGGRGGNGRPGSEVVGPVIMVPLQ